jgi:hypothetical protein
MNVFLRIFTNIIEISNVHFANSLDMQKFLHLKEKKFFFKLSLGIKRRFTRLVQGEK